MKQKLKKNNAGFAHMYLVLIIVVVAAVSFVGGNVYNNQQKKKEAARQAETQAQIEKEKTLEAKETEDSTKESVDVPKENKEAAPVVETKPAPPPPAPAPTKPPETTYEKKPQPTYTTVAISSTSASAGADAVTLKANLPGSYTGLCKALVKRPDGSNALYYEASFGPASTCSVSVPKSKLSAGSWKFYMYIKSSDGTVKGESSSNTFTL